MDIVSRTNVAWGEYDGFETNSYASGWQVYTVLDRLFTDNNGYRSMLFYLGTPVIILMHHRRRAGMAQAMGASS